MDYALTRFAGRQEAEEEEQEIPKCTNAPCSSFPAPAGQPEDDESLSHAEAKLLVLFEITLENQHDADALLSRTCRTAEERRAWRMGTALPGQRRRLRVVGR